MSLFLCVLFLLIALLLWPRESREDSNLAVEFNAMPGRQSRADFIAARAASRLGKSSDKFNPLLTADPNYSPIEVTNLWDELAEDFGIDLSSDDLPEIDSIDELRSSLNSPYRRVPNKAAMDDPDPDPDPAAS